MSDTHLLIAQKSPNRAQLSQDSSKNSRSFRRELHYSVEIGDRPARDAETRSKARNLICIALPTLFLARARRGRGQGARGKDLDLNEEHGYSEKILQKEFLQRSSTPNLFLSVREPMGLFSGALVEPQYNVVMF